MMENIPPPATPPLTTEVTAGPPPEKRIWGPWATAGFGAVVLFVFFAVMVFVIVVISVVLALQGPEPFTDTEAFMDLITDHLGLMISVAGIASSIVGTAAILAVIKVRKGASIVEYLGLKRVGWRTLLLLLLLTGVYVVLVAGIAYVTRIPDTDTGLLVDAYETSVWPALFWISVVVFAPVFEEPFVRGFLFEGFRNSRMGLAGAVILTSLVWTALHVGYGLYSLGAIFIFGIILGLVRYKTGSLWSTVLMHAFYNAIGMTVIALSAA
jgi:hypothetical protein